MFKETYPNTPPVWFAESEDPIVTNAVQILSHTQGRDNHVINQVGPKYLFAFVIRFICLWSITFTIWQFCLIYLRWVFYCENYANYMVCQSLLTWTHCHSPSTLRHSKGNFMKKNLSHFLKICLIYCFSKGLKKWDSLSLMFRIFI